MLPLTLEYRCCHQNTPWYLKHTEVEELALRARLQLVEADVEALSLDVLTQIDRLKINGVQFEMWIDTEHPVHDEQGAPVLGVCEFDGDASPDAALLAVTPVGELASPELVLSTLAHELGHAIFDAPGWIAAHWRGPGLFDDPAEGPRKVYRTTTESAEHLAPPPEASPGEAAALRSSQRTAYFAELRANEFMGSLLVPRPHLTQAATELAPHFGVPLRSGSLLFSHESEARHPASAALSDGAGWQRALAKRFGVHRRFIEVRLARYGLLAPQDSPVL